MKSMNTPLLSVIIPHTQEGLLTREWCEEELKDISHEIVMAATWGGGFTRAQGEFICFLEKDCVLSKDYFKTLLEVFSDKPSYRKLSMVTPVLAANDWNTTIYGYILTPTSVMPSRLKSSTDTYLIQIGFVPGAIIRKSALGFAYTPKKDIMVESVNLSIFFWNHGQRIALSPDATYVSSEASLAFPFHIQRRASKTLTLTVEMWRRELIG